MWEVKIVWLDAVWVKYKEGRDVVREFRSPEAELEIADYLNKGWRIEAAGGGPAGDVPDEDGTGLFCFVVLVHES